MSILNVWWEGIHVGRFEQRDGRIDFVYDDNAPSTPISLSLPRNGVWKTEAPRNFLENLLPSDRNSRYAMMDALGKDTIDSFDLLDRVDATGGLVFSSNDNPPSQEPNPTEYLDDDDIMQRIRSIRRMGNDWWRKDGRCRFSIAGGQGKFTLSRVGDHWAWPNAGLPSTHIFKPEPRDTPDAIQVESSSMRLAGMCGLEVPRTGVIHVKDERSYMVQRFDRATKHGRIVRLHMEDLTQSMGLAGEDKYDVTAEDCVKLLHQTDPSDELSYQWVRQLAFNTYIGNCDAHAKNYSLMLSHDGVRLSPGYDLVSTRYWVRFDQNLAMWIGDQEFPEWVDSNAWARFAKESGLDEDRVVGIATETSTDILERFRTAYRDADAKVVDRVAAVLNKVNEAMIDERTARRHAVMPTPKTEQPRRPDGTFDYKPSVPQAR